MKILLCWLFDIHDLQYGKEKAIWSNGDITYFVREITCKRCGKSFGINV